MMCFFCNTLSPHHYSDGGRLRRIYSSTHHQLKRTPGSWKEEVAGFTKNYKKCSFNKHFQLQSAEFFSWNIVRWNWFLIYFCKVKHDQLWVLFAAFNNSAVSFSLKICSGFSTSPANFHPPGFLIRLEIYYTCLIQSFCIMYG